MMKIKDIVVYVGGEYVGGDMDLEIMGLCSIDRPREGFLVYVEKRKDLKRMMGSEASAILVGGEEGEILSDGMECRKGIILVDDGKLSLIKLLDYFYDQKTRKEGEENGVGVRWGLDVDLGENVVIGGGAMIGDGVKVYSNVVIGEDVVIGEGSVIHSQVVIGRGSRLGKRNEIFGGAVIGFRGFGYYDWGGKRYTVRHLGNVETGDDVDIGGNSTVDCGVLDGTWIGSGTKIDNLVQIGHNCKIGERCYIAGQVGLGGSVVMGEGVILGGQVGVRDHVRIGAGVIVKAKSGVTKSIGAGEVVMGFPARSEEKMKKIWASLSRIPRFLRNIQKESQKKERKSKNDVKCE